MTAPVLERPTVPQVLEMAVAYYRIPGNGVGGSLHNVLADGNLHRRDIRWCREWALQRGDRVGVELADALLQLTMSQMRRLYARL